MNNNILDLELNLLNDVGTIDTSVVAFGENDISLIIEGLSESSRKIALEILDRAQSNVPIDTGFLKSRGDIRQVDNGFEVFYDASYAIYVHEDIDAQHKVGHAKFLEDAYKEVMKEIEGGRVF